MGQNVGITDRIVRIVLAVIFIILGLVFNSWWWFIPAFLALVTGIIGWCGLYALFGWNTCTVEKPVKATKKAKKRKR